MRFRKTQRTTQRALAQSTPSGGAPAAARDHDASDVVLRVDDLHVDFASEAGVVHAVRGVSFALHRGETLGIVGESGSGKSVTSMSIMGLLDDNASVHGSITFRGEELLTKTDEQMSEIRGDGIAMVFQDPLSALTPVYTIGEQLREALVIHNPHMSSERVRERSIELLELVGIPNASERLRSYPHEFSGGMRQRVVIAMAIANNPDVIIADEPTTALDVTIQAQVLEVLQRAQQETGAALIFITHDLGVIAGIADNVVVMYAGRPVEQADVDSIFYRPVMPYTMGLLGASPHPRSDTKRRLIPIPGSPVNLVSLPEGCAFAARCPLATDECRRIEPELREVPGRDGQRAACLRTDMIIERGLTYDEVYEPVASVHGKFDGVPREDRQIVLDVHDLSKTFPLSGGGFLRRRVGEVHAVDDVSIEVREGETVALVGESGSGKSTTLLEIMGLKEPQSGSIELFGERVSKRMPKSERRALHKYVQYVFQDPMSSLDPRLPVYDILAEPLRATHASRAEINERISELMRLVELNPDQVDRFPTQFSGGQRQRIAIARALAVRPKLILLDEPVSALDVSIQAGVINLLEDLQAKLGVAYLFVAHNLSVIRHISTRVAVMYLGRIVESGPTRDVFKHPLHPYTKALLSAVPAPDPKVERTRERIVLQGDVPGPTQRIEGCAFASRCPLYQQLTPEQQAVCDTKRPRMRQMRAEEAGDGDRKVACHFADSTAARHDTEVLEANL